MSTSYCPHCGAQHANAAAFCPNTGRPIEQGAAAPPPPQQYAAPPQQYAPPPPAYAPPPQQQYAPPPPAYAPPPQQQYAPPPHASASPPQQLHPVAALPRGGQPMSSAEALGYGGVRHQYPLAIRDAGLGTAVGLLMRTMPYALARFGVLFAVSVITIVWWVVALGGWFLLADKVANLLGFAWFVGCCVVYGSFWRFVVRYFLYLLKCGHIAVLTELLTKGRIDDGGKGMFAYGKDVVTARFGEVNALLALDLLVRGVVNAFNRSLDFIANLIPLPGMDSVSGVVRAVLRASTTYLDETIFSYGLARGDNNPWRSAQDGLVYYAQNSKEVLKTGLFIVVLDKVLTFFAWGLMLIPALLLSMLLPHSIRSWGSFFIVGMAALFASNLRSAFLKPLFLIMVMVKFHVVIRDQAIDAQWDERLTRASSKFSEIKQKVLDYAPRAGSRA